MSAVATSNRLPMVLAGILFVLVLLVIGLRLMSGGSVSFTLGTVPATPVADADSPATVIKTLSVQVEDVRERNAALQQDNQALHDQVGQLSEQLAQLFQQPPAPANDNAQFEQLQTEINRLKLQLKRQPSDSSSAQPQPVNHPLIASTQATDTLVWIEPLDADAQRTPPAANPLVPVSFNPNPLTMTVPTDASALSAPAAAPSVPPPPPVVTAEPQPIPVYTVPADSALMDATAWTALLGRIPVGGAVRDPWRFKVLTGTDNLAANGIRIPGLSGMIWSGRAVGDLAMSCVSGELYSVTFVFNDGRISTTRTNGQDPLGWISDDSGIPCIPGTLKTNAPQWLATRTFMLALEAGANAYADAETTTVIGPLGDERTRISGNADRYALGSALSSSTRDARRWIDERQRQSFDAIFVPPGTRLTINVETEIAIDYKPNGRQVSYRHTTHNPYRSSGLD